MGSVEPGRKSEAALETGGEVNPAGPLFVKGLPAALTVVEGQPLLLHVTLKGREPMKVCWRRGGVLLPDSPDFRHLTEGHGRHGLLIADLFLADSGHYTCIATSPHGRATSTLYLTVIGVEREQEKSSQDKVEVQPGQLFKQEYTLCEELGKGRYGTVYRVVKDDSSLAAKFVRTVKKQDKDKAFQEIAIMNSLKHPKLLQLRAAFENPKDIILIMEYISGGELFERVVADDFTLTEKDSILFMRQICEGVGYMHHCNVVHLDLKPENIMCETRQSHKIKLIDFGLAQQLDPNSPVRVLFGTPEFMPPEIINYEPIGTLSDMWSVGVICYVLLSGLSPFLGDTDPETFTNVTRAEFDFDDEAFHAISEDAKHFISALLINRKEKRLSANECLKHKWLSQADNSMSKIALSKDKLKKFLIHQKWQKTGNAIRALGRMASLSARRRPTAAAIQEEPAPTPQTTVSSATPPLSPLLSSSEVDCKRERMMKECSSSVGVQGPVTGASRPRDLLLGPNIKTHLSSS